MKNTRIKPETMERLAREHAERRLANAWELERKTAAKAAEQPDSIWPELLSEQRERMRREYHLPANAFSRRTYGMMAQAKDLANGLPIYLQSSDDDEVQS